MIELPLLLLMLCNLFTLLGVYSIYNLFIGVFNLKKAVTVAAFFSVLTVMVIGSYDWLLLPSTISEVVLYTSITNRKFLKMNVFSILFACTLQIFISEISVCISYALVYKINHINSVAYVCTMFCILTIVLSGILIYFLKPRISVIRGFMDNAEDQILIITFTLLLFLIVYTIQSFIDLSGKNSTLQLGAILFFLVMLVLDALFLRTYIDMEKKRYKIKEQSERNKEFKQYLEELAINYDQLRAFKHDFQNILVTIGIMAQDNDELKKYVSKITGHTNNLLSNKIDLLSLEKINNLPLKSLILSKILKARAKGISFYLELDKPLNHLMVNDVVIIRIVAILLDNAIEYGINFDCNSNISLLIDNYDQSGYDIVIENDLKTTEGVSLEKWFTPYTTKGKGHGFGLNSVKKLVNDESNLNINVEIVKQRVRFTLMVGDT
ncbi:sensor histidine kinase [Limosilactobacillus reuteri]|uniref:sensor histidine kinase n=1 Tax=Limosilactobacillus reuteri TaxID=1598 RepID=UPI001C5AE39B|nr:GHKL domain-containing protein [Limosilactobacillus reuteri]MBW3351335.1 GHKL domain-containing protein [Limosilactobacillus reuteri]UUW69727.1 GHKL domain-containing protein [Limosilactobacillus reuteri]